MTAKGMPNKRQKSADDAVTPSKKAKKEIKQQEAPKSEKKVKTEVKAEPVPKTPKKEKKEQNKISAEPPAKREKKATETEEAPVEVKSDKKHKKKDKKKNKAQPTAAVEEKAEDAYVPGALSALFGGGGGGAEKSDAAPKEDIFAKYADGDNGFVDVPTVIGEVEKKAENPEENTRKKQRENRKKNLHAPEIVDERKRTVFVGNLPKEFTVKRLRTLFADCGKIDSVRLRGTVGSKETLSKKTAFLSGKVNENIKSIVGYVKFASQDTVAVAIKKNGTVVDDHHIRVDGCVAIKNYDRKSTIFVGNLPFEISDDDLIEWAEACVGPVDFVRVIRDRNTGYGRGVGFITFKEDASVPVALALASPVIGGKEVRLQKVMKKSEKKELRKGDGKRMEKRKQKKLDKKKAAAGAKRPHSETVPVNPLLGPVHASKKVQKEIKKRRKMSGPKSLMK